MNKITATANYDPPEFSWEAIVEAKKKIEELVAYRENTFKLLLHSILKHKYRHLSSKRYQGVQVSKSAIPELLREYDYRREE